MLKIFNGHTQPVNDAKVLPDGRILSWSEDNTLRIWSSNGELQATYQKDTLFKLNDVIWKTFLPANQQTENMGIIAFRSVVTICNSVGTKLIWHATSECAARNLLNDGRAIVTQANGQVCFLSLWSGNNRIALDQLTTEVS
jgi:WD40 repeat protein